MSPHAFGAATAAGESARLRQRWRRERRARLEAEAIAEERLGVLFAHEQRLELLEAVATAANQAATLDQALALALPRLAAAVGYPVGHAYLLREAGEMEGGGGLAPGIWCGLDTPGGEALRRATEQGFDPREGLPGEALAAGEATWMGDWPQRAARAAQFQSAFAFPVRRGADTMAVVEFFHPLQCEPDRGALRCLEQVGALLGQVAERERYEARLAHDAAHDPLTGLANRAHLLERLHHAAARGRRRPGDQFAVLFLDLDRFKWINDSLGHQAGDELLIEAAERLRGALRTGDELAMLARLGGDEFTVLLEDIGGVHEAVAVAERLQQALAPPFAVAGQEVFLSASIGIALGPDGGSGSDERAAVGDVVLRNADLAMYRAKARGKARCEIFDAPLHIHAVRRLELEGALRRGLERGEFRVHYQPVVALASGRVSGVEALVRWQREDRLWLPDEFLDIAEETGVILPLGLWVLEEACAAARTWDGLAVGVNLSARQFHQPGLADHVGQILARTGLDPRRLRLEITETAMMSHSAHTLEVLQQLKDIGVRLGVDDFGTGYSSLRYLHRFPLDILKIDRSFLAPPGEGRDAAALLPTIVQLARNLGLQIVAEGAETEAQAEQVRKLGCELAQGFYFARPMEAEALDSWIRTSGPRSGGEWQAKAQS